MTIRSSLSSSLHEDVCVLSGSKPFTTTTNTNTSTSPSRSSGTLVVSFTDPPSKPFVLHDMPTSRRRTRQQSIASEHDGTVTTFDASCEEDDEQEEVMMMSSSSSSSSAADDHQEEDDIRMTSRLSQVSLTSIDEMVVTDLHEDEDNEQGVDDWKGSVSSSCCDDDDDDGDSTDYPNVFVGLPTPASEDQDDEDRGTVIPITARRRHSSASILRRHSSIEDFHYIRTKKAVWKSLPPPDVSSRVIRCSSEPTPQSQTQQQQQQPQRQQRRSVSFGDVHVRQYQRTLSDNPSVSYGPPIGLDWNYLQIPSISVDVYESTQRSRITPKTTRQLMLNYYQRKHILGYKLGISKEELKQAQHEANKCKRQRALTRALLPASKLEELFQSVFVTTKRTIIPSARQSTSS